MQENFESLQQSIQKLEKSINDLDQRIKKQTSIKRNFLISLVRGFASVVGATIVFGLIVALIIQIVRTIDYVPIINNILNSQAIENVINKFTALQ